MRVPAVVLSALLLLSSPLVQTAALDTVSIRSSPHVRTGNRLLADAIVEGVARSPTFARIIAGLKASNVVAYVDLDNRLPSGFGGRTRLVTAAGGWRYVRIGICRHLSEYQRIGMIAHELQHALEIAGAPEVMDARSLARLYRIIGRPSSCGSRCYETARAVWVEREVGRDLQRSARNRDAASRRSVAGSSRGRGAFVVSEE